MLLARLDFLEICIAEFNDVQSIEYKLSNDVVQRIGLKASGYILYRCCRMIFPLPASSPCCQASWTTFKLNSPNQTAFHALLSRRLFLAPIFPVNRSSTKARIATESSFSESSAENEGEQLSFGLNRTLLLGAMFGVWYLLNICFNNYNKQVYPFPATVIAFQFGCGALMVVTIYTIKDQQAAMRFKVLQGNRPLSKDCVELGMFGLEITPAPRGVTKVVVTFELDVNGILTVTAKERTPLAKSKSLTIIDYKGYLTEAEIEKMTREAKMMAEEDQLAKARVEAMNAFERYIYDVKTAMKKPEIRNMISSDEDRRVVETAVEEASRWLNVNKDATKEDYDENLKKLMDVWNPVITNNGF